MKRRKILFLPLPIAIAVIVLFIGGGALIYALTKTTEKAGPVGYWKFDEGAGTVAYDASGNNNNGTLTNFDFNDTSNWTTGKVAGALKFDGSNDYVGVPTTTNSVLDITGAITIEAWAKADSVDPPEPITQTWQVATSSDDARRVYTPSSYWETVANGFFVARWNSSFYNYGSPARFLNVTIPAGSTITQANLILTCNLGLSTTVINTRLRAQVNINPLTFSTSGDFDARTWTNAYVNWDNIPAWTAETVYTSPDIKATIQEVINLANWTSGNPMVILWDDFEMRSTQVDGTARDAYTYDSSPTKAPKLVITYTPPKTIVSKGNDSYALKMSADGSTLQGYINNTKITASVATPLAWHHYALTYDGSNQKLYIDGVLASSSALSGAIVPNATNLKIGDLFSGSIDDVRIYNRALSAAEVSWNYNRGGPVGWWKFDEGTASTTYDSSGNGNTGTWSGSGPTHWASGKINGAGQFNGTNDYVNAGSGASLNIIHPLTVGAWIFIPLGVTESQYTHIYGSYDSVALNGFALGVYIDGLTNRLAFWDTSAWRSSPSVLATGVWNFVAVVADGSATKFYINGILDLSTAGAVIPSYTGNKTIGSRSDGTYNFNGLIDDVRIYNYGRTAAEIRTDYNSGFAVRFGGSYDLTQGLVGYWNFDEGGGTTAYDSSGNSNSGTLKNFDFNSSSNWITGKVAGALELDGSNDYINVTDSDSLDIADALTIEAWVKLNKITGIQDVVSKYQMGDPSKRSYILYVSGDEVVTTITKDGTANTFAALSTTNADLTIGNWYHLVFTYEYVADNSSIMKIYVNGMGLASSTDARGPIYTSDVDMLMGTSYQSGVPLTDRFSGSIDEVRIYSRALSVDEIRYLYNRKGPVGWWKFDEGSGSTAYDSSGNGNNGTIYGASSTVGKINSALSFDGATNYVNIENDSSLSPPSEITIEAWIYWHGEGTSGGWNAIVGKWESGVEEYFFGIEDTTHLLGFLVPGGVVESVSSISQNIWTHVAVAVDENTDIAAFYINGVLNKSVSQTNDLLPNSSPLRIGQAYGSLNWYDGLIDDVRIYNYARSASEIRTDYNAGFAVRFGGSYDLTQGLVGYWNFEDGAGRTAYDSSGSGNNGTLKNFDFNLSSGWTSGNSAAKTGSALKFDGSNDYVEVASSTSLNITDEITFGVWLNPNAGYGQTWPRIMTNGIFQMLISATDGAVFMGINSLLSDWQTALWNGPLSTTAWTYIVGTYDKSLVSGNLKIYINGNVQASTTETSGGDASDFDTTYIGGYPSRLFNGLIDEVRIYNRALSSDEIRYLYNRKQPIAYWKFDDGAGQYAYDSSINGNTGTLGSTTSPDAGDPTWTEGYINRALSFDGIDDYVNCGSDASLNPTNAVTFELWVNPESAPAWGYWFIKKESVYYPNYNYLMQFFDTTGKVWANLWDGNSHWITSNSIVPLNQWTHVAFTYNGNEAKFYFNGISDPPTTLGPISIWASDSELTISTSVGNKFDGLIDDVRIYNYARTAAEIRTDYNAGMSTYFK